VPLRRHCFGLSVALATPFAEDRSIDLADVRRLGAAIDAIRAKRAA